MVIRVLRKLLVKQKNQHTLDEHILAECIVEIENNHNEIAFCYEECDTNKSKVNFVANQSELKIHRFSEAESRLTFKLNQKTEGVIMSEYGEFCVDLYTRKLICSQELVAIEYDVLNGDEVVDAYRILWKIRRSEA